MEVDNSGLLIPEILELNGDLLLGERWMTAQPDGGIFIFRVLDGMIPILIRTMMIFMSLQVLAL